MADLATTPILVDADDIAQVGFDQFATYFPGWAPTDGDFTTRLAQAFAAIIAENQSLATQALAELIEFFGGVLGLPPFAASAATGASQWAMTDSVGVRTIPAGTNVAINGLDGTPVTFIVVEDVIVADGFSQTDPEGVALIAADTGTQGNGLTGDIVFLDQLAFVDSATLAQPTVGGLDAETTSAYLARFQKFARILAPRPILPLDFALIVQVFFPVVQRCLAIDEYNADTATSGEPRCVTVVPIDVNGNAMTADILAAIRIDLQNRRELTFETFAISPTYTTVDIAFNAVSIQGYDTGDVETRAISALQTFLSPARWGLPPSGDLSVWIDQPKVRFQDVVTVLNNVDGLDYYTVLTVQGAGADVTLTGPGGLPQAGVITGSVVGP